MAVTKIWAIKDSLQRVLDYAANPDKTEYDALAQTLHYAENDAKTKLNESAQLVTGIHCRADHAWEDMRAVQERFGKADGVVALHAYQSFREGEVTPEQCHEIGVALARKVWGKRFQVLVATHMNTYNLHNHFVINSVSPQGYLCRKRRPPNFLRGILWGIPNAPLVSVLLLSAGYPAQETSTAHQPPGVRAHLERH